MKRWSIHMLNSRGQLAEVLPILSDIISIAEKACGAVHPPVYLDLSVRAADWPMPPELIVSGAAYSPARIDMTIDLSHDIPIEEMKLLILRTLYHEFHHVLRWDGPGYGETLGEALVSEGLAQHFVHEMTDCTPEPWERAVSNPEMNALTKNAVPEFEDAGYDHAAWFFGAGDYPKWAGYSLGYAMVEKYLAANPEASALTCASLPATAFKKFLT